MNIEEKEATRLENNEGFEFIGFGSCGEVGRSAFLIRNGKHTILLEAGIKLRPYEPSLGPEGLDEYASEIDAIILSHAHVDHSGYIPALYKNGFKGKVYMTLPTIEIVELLWKDHLKIEKERHWTEENLYETLDNIVGLHYNTVKEILPGITLKFVNAGHILGSAQSIIDWDGYKILYTGDINDNKTGFFDGFQLVPDDIDLLISETTNGDVPVPSREIVNELFVDEIREVLNSGRKVIIPCFAVGRSQEILTVLAEKVHDYPIYIDGMINKMNRITERYLDENWVSGSFLKRGFNTNNSPFKAKNMVAITHENFDYPYEFRKHLGELDEPCIIISTSGMMMPSPIHSHLKFNANDPGSLISFVGYQAEGTIGREVLEGSKIIVTKNRNRERKIYINSRVMQFKFSGHSSAEGIKKMIDAVKPKDLIFVHGDDVNRFDLTSKLSNGFKVHNPVIGLPIKLS